MSDTETVLSPLERGTHESSTQIKTFQPDDIVVAQANARARIFEQFDVGAILGELTDTTKVWWKSKVILSALAALIMLALERFEVLPAWVTQDGIISFLVVAIPLIGTIVARFGATDRVVAKQPPLEGKT